MFPKAFLLQELQPSAQSGPVTQCCLPPSSHAPERAAHTPAPRTQTKFSLPRNVVFLVLITPRTLPKTLRHY